MCGLLEDGLVMRLATHGPAGPHVVPVWYMHRGGRIYVGTNSGTVKARNVAATGSAAFCVDVGVRSPDIRGVSGRGRARLISDPGEVSRIASDILLRYMDSLDSPAARELLADTDCIIEVEPGPTVSWTY